MNKINDDGVSDNYRRNNNVTGAVTRGDKVTIDFVLPIEENKITAYNSEMILRWVPAIIPEKVVSFDGKTFVVTIENIFDEVIFKQETTKSSMALNLDEIKNESDLYLITITTKEETEADELKSIEYAVEKVSMDDNPELKSELDAIFAEIDKESSMGKLVLASFYEEKGLLMEAMTHFEEIVKSNPDVLAFQELYQEFLAKNKMVVGSKEEGE